MKAKDKFLKMYYKLPGNARTELVYDFTKHPMTLAVILHEVLNDTKISKEILSKLGYKADGLKCPDCNKEIEIVNLGVEGSYYTCPCGYEREVEVLIQSKGRIDDKEE